MLKIIEKPLTPLPVRPRLETCAACGQHFARASRHVRPIMFCNDQCVLQGQS